MKDFNTKEIREHISVAINELLECKRAKSKAEVARYIGLTPQGLSEILGGRNKITLEFIHRLCVNYGVSYKYIVEGITPIFDYESMNDSAFSMLQEEAASLKLHQLELASKNEIIAAKNELIAKDSALIESLDDLIRTKTDLIKTKDAIIELLEYEIIRLKKNHGNNDTDEECPYCQHTYKIGPKLH